MRGFKRPTSSLLLAAALGAVSCAYPTDKSDKVFVTLESPSHVVLRGQDMSVYAQAWRVVGVDTQAIGNVDFLFQTGSSSIARVEKDGGGYATVTGVNSGTVDITARAIAFEQAGQADLVLRVSNPLEIDSVRPLLAHHGDTITVYGVGVDSMFIASLDGVNLIEYPFSRVRDLATGLGQIKFWIPPPARSAPLFYLGAGVFGFNAESTHMVFQDVFEPNDSVPSQINLDVPGPWPGTPLAPIIFTNPALAFEPLLRSTSGQDWFRFPVSDTTQALTFFITYPTSNDTAATRTFLLDSLYYLAGAPGDPPEKFASRLDADFIGSDFSRCKGLEFDPVQVTRESTTVALKTLPSHAIHVVTFFTKPQRYGLTVARGYFTADTRIGADKFEENDMCHYADSIPGKANPPSRLHISTVPFSDTASIDNPFETDWYRLEVTTGAGDSVLFRLQSRPFIAGRDTSDIDFYILTVPGSTGPLTVVDSSVSTGSTESLLTSLATGSYYLAVVDYAGSAMRYSLCIRRITSLTPRVCGLIQPGPPVPGSAKTRRLQPAASAGLGSAGSLFVPRRRQ